MAVLNLNRLIQRISDFLENRIKPIFQFVIYLRVPTAISLATYLIFANVDQTIEVYRSIALDRDIFKAILATFFVAILAIFVWYAARLLQYWQAASEQRSQTASRQGTPDHSKWRNILYTWIPRFLGIVPILGLSVGIFSTQSTLAQSTPAQLTPAQSALQNFPKIFLWIWFFCTLATAISIFVLFIRRVDLFYRTSLKALASRDNSEGLFSPIVEIVFINVAYIIFSAISLPLIAAATGSTGSLGVISVLVLLTLLNGILFLWHKEQSRTILGLGITCLLVSEIFLYVLPTTAIPSFLGSISVVAISFTILVVIFSTIYHWGLQKKIPAITILVILVVLSSATNINDNHQFRQFAKLSNSSLPALETSFQQWLANRPDRDQYAGKPYPVYVASAQGGGIFAAYHASTALAKLTEYVPNFPQHLFAISGVSGGSLGASAFASLVKTNHGSSQTLSDRASQIFKQDLLSPLLALGLFPDLIQRFIPFSIYDWDRATGLEIAFENSWDQLHDQAHENPFRQSFYQHWQPQGNAPALVLNTTVVESGDRLVISPFKILSPTQENIALDESNLDLKLSTAAGLSARFPYVTPVGWYRRSSDNSKLRLADGGYFDNSGIPTAIDIGRNLQRIEGHNKTFELIYLAVVDQPINNSGNPLESPGENEIFSPIRALFGAREARSRSAVELSTYTLNDGITDPFKLKFRTLMLKKAEKGVKLPLGWLLSERSRKFIDQQTPAPSQCNVEKFQQALISKTPSADVYNHNSCVAKSIGDDLS